MACKNTCKNNSKKDCAPKSKGESCKYINLKESSPCSINKTGQVNHYKEEKIIQGETYQVKNENHYDNYYTKYNHYYVTDVNYVTDHVKEYNVIHKKTETVYNGTKHSGCKNTKCNCGDCKFCKSNQSSKCK